MSQIKAYIKNRVDGVLLMLLFFVLSLALLFLYLQNIDTNIKNYYAYKKTVEELHLYNHKLDIIFMRSYRYLDNDEVTRTTQIFGKELEILKKNELTHQFGRDIENRLTQIDEKYVKKVELIESFKTLNARITTSIYYLYTLTKEIKKNANTGVEVERLLSDVLFHISQVFLDEDINVLVIDKELKEVAVYVYLDENMEYFYQHMKQFIIDVTLLKKILNKNKILDLETSLTELNEILERAYLANQEKEELIGLIFFVFAFVILVILFNMYFKVLVNRKKMKYLAYHDTLTGLPNRTDFERYIESLITKESIHFMVLFIDLDRFKVINDTLGHDVGDEMLIILSKRIRKVLGAKNFLARIGGDEFVALIEKEEDIKIVEILVTEIASTIRFPIKIKEYNLNTTASIGIARYPHDGADKQTLLKHADAAMYFAKDKGRDTYAFYTKKLSTDVQRRLDLEQELVNALKKKEFSLYYQPQYHLSSGQITGAEALVRWRSSLLGSVSPEEFIAVAEDTGIIVELGYYIFHQACSDYMRWRKEGVNINLIAINISSVQLRQVDAFTKFKDIIDEVGIDPKHIEIELTERYIMEYTTEKLTILDDLRALGCRISIDDFGTGYSSMSYLRSLEIDTIKIDKSFILDLPESKNDAEVSKAIIVLSQTLGYEVIAEGIETVEQELLLKEYNCDMGQGYYFARPMKSDDIVTFYYRKKS